MKKELQVRSLRKAIHRYLDIVVVNVAASLRLNLSSRKRFWMSEKASQANQEVGGHLCIMVQLLPVR